MSDASLIIPGLIQVGAYDEKKRASLVLVGSAVGWTMPRGIHTWRREVSVVRKADLTGALLTELGVVLPEQQGEPAQVARARRAAEACTLVAVEGAVAEQVVAKGLVVHTIGFDSVSGGFFYLARGGKSGRRVQGELVEMVAASLGDGGNDELEARLDGLIDRLLVELSEGALSEVQVELADALPPLGPKNRMGAARLQGLEGWLILTSTRSSQFEGAARQIAADLRGSQKDVALAVPLFGEARQVQQPALDVVLTIGDEGDRARITLPVQTRWLVSGRLVTPSQAPAAIAAPDAAAKEAAAKENAAKAAAAKEVAAKEAAAKEAAAKEAAAKAAREAAAKKEAADKEARERAAVAKLNAEKQAAEQAEVRRLAAERAANERAAAERAAAKAASAREAAEKAAAERAAAERLAEEKVAAEKAAAEKAALERLQAEKAAEEAALAEKEAAEQAAAEKVAAEEAALAEATAEKAALEKAEEQAGMEARESAERAKKTKPASSLPLAIGAAIVILAVLAILAMFRH